jgi:hydroxymethylbilane synthase
MIQSAQILRLGTRGSLLAKTQSQWVADELMRVHSKLRVELRIFKTSGDQVTDRPLHDIGGKGLFTKELEQAILAGDVDFAVHSFKDVPVTMPLVDQSDLVIAAVPRREDPRDVAVVRDAAVVLTARGARVGTSSLRRTCQIREISPHAEVIPLRGNIDTRLRKLRDGEYDVIILAMAGLKRVGLFDPTYMTPLDPDRMRPAPGQGALALQCRRDDSRTGELLRALDDPETEACVTVEREVVRRLQGDCHSPIAASAQVAGDRVKLRAAVGARDGGPPVIRASAASGVDQPAVAVDAVMRSLEAQGVRELLAAPA